MIKGCTLTSYKTKKSVYFYIIHYDNQQSEFLVSDQLVIINTLIIDILI